MNVQLVDFQTTLKSSNDAVIFESEVDSENDATIVTPRKRKCPAPLCSHGKYSYSWWNYNSNCQIIQTKFDLFQLFFSMEVMQITADKKMLLVCNSKIYNTNLRLWQKGSYSHYACGEKQKLWI